MSSIYDGVISTLFAVGKAEVVCHRLRENVVRKGVVKVKCQRNRMRQDIGTLSTSKMTIKVYKLSDHQIRMVFELVYSVDI